MTTQIPKGTLAAWASFTLALFIGLGSLWYKIDDTNQKQNVRIAQIEIQILQIQQEQSEMKLIHRDLAVVLNNFSTSITQLQVTVENNTKALERIERQLDERDRRYDNR